MEPHRRRRLHRALQRQVDGRGAMGGKLDQGRSTADTPYLLRRTDVEYECEPLRPLLQPELELSRISAPAFKPSWDSSSPRISAAAIPTQIINWFPKNKMILTLGLETNQNIAFNHQGDRVYHYSNFDPFFVLPRNFVFAPIVGQNSDTVGPPSYSAAHRNIRTSRRITAASSSAARRGHN